MTGSGFAELEKKIIAAEGIYIYGAGIVGYGICEAVASIYNSVIISYVATECNNDEQTYAGRTLLEVNELPFEDDNELVIIATPEIYQDNIIQRLSKVSRISYIALNYKDVYEIMQRYYRKEYGFISLADLPEYQEDKTGNLSDITCSIFMAKSEHDVKLEQKVIPARYIIPVQGGSVLSDKKIGSFGDDLGENISEKNRSYSELTVTYWAWKNCNSEYKGICHYRRYLDLSDDDYLNVFGSDVDVVLPFPYLCRGDASFQWKRYISEKDMNFFFSTLKFEEKNAALKALSDTYIYNHNLLIAKREIYDDYCSWLFKTLFNAESYFVSRDRELMPRLMGYLGEILTDIYFIVRRNELKIVHAPEKWMV